MVAERGGERAPLSSLIEKARSHARQISGHRSGDLDGLAMTPVSTACPLGHVVISFNAIPVLYGNYHTNYAPSKCSESLPVQLSSIWPRTPTATAPMTALVAWGCCSWAATLLSQQGFTPDPKAWICYLALSPPGGMEVLAARPCKIRT
jgi:hypothetical protein